MANTSNVLGTINLPRDSTLQGLVAQMTISNQLKKLELQKAGIDVDATDWKSFQSMVRSGTLLVAYNIGDQFKTKRGDDTLIWDLVHYGKDDNGNYAVLQMHNTYKNLLALTNNEALFYVAATLPAGTYHFTMKADGWDAYKGSYQFTTTKAIPEGGQIGFNSGASSSILPKQIITYSTKSSTTPLETVSLAAGTGGTDLSTVGAINLIYHAVYGNNNYKNSDIRQWLNSDKTAGNVWTPQTDYARPPAWGAIENGFMNQLDEEFVQVVVAETQKVALNNISESGGNEEIKDKFFLASRSQVNATDETISEGITWDYYTKFRADKGTGRNDGSDTNRVKYYDGAVRNTWLRTPANTSAFATRIIDNTGKISAVASLYLTGVVPACIIR